MFTTLQCVHKLYMYVAETVLLYKSFTCFPSIIHCFTSSFIHPHILSHSAALLVDRDAEVMSGTSYAVVVPVEKVPLTGRIFVLS